MYRLNQFIPLKFNKIFRQLVSGRKIKNIPTFENERMNAIPKSAPI
jgi:hypothetical protein